MKQQPLSIRRFNNKVIKEVVAVMHTTIKQCYPVVYQPQVVAFFLDYHSEEKLLERAERGEVYTFYLCNKIVGTGFIDANEIGGLYLLPNYQNFGYGGQAFQFLVHRAKELGLKSVWLDATPGSKRLYQRMGFKIIEEKIMYVEDKTPLPYTYMEYVF